jgi:hypothetical protein
MGRRPVVRNPEGRGRWETVSPSRPGGREIVLAENQKARYIPVRQNRTEGDLSAPRPQRDPIVAAPRAILELEGPRIWSNSLKGFDSRKKKAFGFRCGFLESRCARFGFRCARFGFCCERLGIRCPAMRPQSPARQPFADTARTREARSPPSKGWAATPALRAASASGPEPPTRNDRSRTIGHSLSAESRGLERDCRSMA